MQRNKVSLAKKYFARTSHISIQQYTNYYPGGKTLCLILIIIKSSLQFMSLLQRGPTSPV
jgi:hypothetical protein